MPPRYPIFVLTVAVLIGLCFGATPSAAQPPFNVIGQWSQPFQPFTQPYFPVHSHMLPTGKVMFWPGDGGVSGNDPRSWDPANPGQSASSLSKPGYDIFCSGHSFLADGRLFVAGGHNGSNNVGLSRASTYNPFATTNAWSNLSDMNDGRWYPTTTVLANGDILVVSGSIDLTVGSNPEPQVFQIARRRDVAGPHQRAPRAVPLPLDAAGAERPSFPCRMDGDDPLSQYGRGRRLERRSESGRRSP